MSPAEKDRIVRMVDALIAEVTRLTTVPTPPEVVPESTRLFVHPDYRKYVEAQ